jgi:propionyl-CoA carboxylase beta chain
MVKETSHMFITGPDVIKTVTGEEVGFEELGGAMTHNTKSGVAHFAADDEDACLEDTRYLLSFLPSNNLELPPRVAPSDDPMRMDEELDHVVPDNPNKPYDMRDVVRLIVDDGEFLEVHEHHAKNIICGFSRLDGFPVGIVGNQPAALAGVLDIDASAKAARFVRTCDAFNIPLLTLVDVPGFLPGTSQEWGGIIRHGAKLLYAFTEATVPKLTVITRKAYGGAYDVMASKHMLADFNFAWPTAEVAVMGPEGAVNIIYRRDIAASPTPEQRRQKLIADYKAHFANPYSAAERGYIDDVIVPHETRPKLITALHTLRTKRDPGPQRKHGNIPL